MEKKTHRLPVGCGYRMVRRLGSGGEGTVYLVCHQSTEQLRAAKILTAVHGDRRHELDLMKHLDHPSLPKVIDVLADEENIWLIMEYIRGRRLDGLVGEGLLRSQLFSIALQLTEAVRYLHTRKEPILHLDIKPSNLLIRPDGSLVLIDFGAAIRGHPDPAAYEGYGTRGFAAPEQQKKGAQIDARTDIYGIGATLYYCKFGKPPSAGSRCSGPLGSVIRKCLAEDPAGRFQDCDQLLRSISRSRKKGEIGRRIVPAVGVASVGTFLLLFVSTSGGLPAKGQGSRRELLALAERGTEGEAEVRTERMSEAGAERGSRDGTENEWDREQKEGADAQKEPEDDGGTEHEDAAGTKYEEEPGTEGESGTEAEEGSEDFSADHLLQMLDQVTADGLFDAEEEDALQSLLFCAPDGSDETLWSRLQEDREACPEAAYRLGLAYWYFYEGAGGKSTAARWFDRALSAASGEEAASWTTTAEVFSRIGKYYDMLGNTGREKERLSMEWEYWNDLKELWRLFAGQEEMAAVRAEQAKELLSLEILKAYEIGRCGETQEEMLRILTEVEAFAEESEEPEELIRQSDAARSAVERAYQELMGEEDLWVETESVG